MKSKVIRFVFAIAIVGLMALPALQTVSAAATPQDSTPWCGTTSETKNYGFTMSLKQDHWTVNGEQYVTQSTINEVDTILDKLNGDNIANTMILFLDQNQISNAPNCAGHFLQYMKLGNLNGPRADNGFAILFKVTKTGAKVTSVGVNYSVGGSLNALQPDGMKEMNRLAQAKFEETKSVDETYLAVIKYFDQYARSKYDPYVQATQTTAESTRSFAGDCLTLLVIIVIVVLVLIALRKGGGGGYGSTYGTNTYTWPTHSPSRPSSPSRGGGGSGRTSRVG